MPNKVYLNPETTITWDDAGASNEDINSYALGADAVSSCGSYVDLGSAARSEWYMWGLFIDGFATGSTTVGRSVDLYWSQGNGTSAGDFDGPPDGTPSTTAAWGFDATSNTERKQKLPNLLYAGSAIIYSTTNTEDLKASGIIRLTGRYVFPVLHNKALLALASVNTHTITLTPIPPEVQ